MSTKDTILASWRGAQRAADVSGVVTGNPATVAGQYLELAGGDARRAISALPMGGVFWARVRSILMEIAESDSVARTGTG